MVDTAMIQKLFEIHYNLKFTVIKIKRKEMKVIVDSINEQLCSYFFQQKPSGQNTRALINKRMHEFSIQEDKEVLIAQEAVLREYPNVFSSTYADHNSDFKEFMNNEMKKLCKALTEHSIFRNDDNAKRLRGLL